MAYEARVLGPDVGEQWQRLWGRSSRLAQHHWQWGRIAATQVGEPRRVGILDSGGELKAGATFVARTRRMMHCWAHPSPAPFCGLLHAERELGEEKLRDWLSAMSSAIPPSVDQVEIIMQPGLLDVRGLSWSGWESRFHYNYSALTESADVFEARIASKARGHLKRARDSGRIVTEGDDLLGELLRLWEHTRSRKGIEDYVHPDAYRELLAWIRAEGDAELGIEVLAVRHDAAIEAGMILLHDRTRSTYLFGATDPEMLGSGAPTLLVVEAMQRAAARGANRIFDYCGANTPSVAQFKKEFRPELEVCAFASRGRAKAVLLDGLRRWRRRAR